MQHLPQPAPHREIPARLGNGSLNLNIPHCSISEKRIIIVTIIEFFDIITSGNN